MTRKLSAVLLAAILASSGTLSARADPATILGAGAAGIYILKEGLDAAEKIIEQRNNEKEEVLRQQRENFREKGHY